MIESQLFATADNVGISLSAILAARVGRGPGLPLGLPSAGDNTVPLLPSPSATMTPGVAYPSWQDQNQLLYLPAYQVSLVELRPVGAGGTLLAQLTAAAPAPISGKTMTIVPHVLRAELVYSVPDDQNHPVATIRHEFSDATDAPSLTRTLTLNIAPPADPSANAPPGTGDFIQVFLALKKLWSPVLIVTAQMQVAVPSRRAILVDRTALVQTMMTARPIADRVAAPVVARAAATPARTSMVRPAAMMSVARPMLAMSARIAPVALPRPIFRPDPPAPLPPLPLPFPSPMGPTRILTVAGQTVSSHSLAPPVRLEMPLSDVREPANAGLRKIACAGPDLWIDEAKPLDFYYLPQSFRLSLAPAGSDQFLTALVAFEGTTSDPTQLNVELTMILKPYLDHRNLRCVLSAAQAELARRKISGTPNLAVLEPPITQIEWWVPSPSGADQSQVFPVGEASFTQGLQATLPMAYRQFQHIVDRFLLPWSDGLQGNVRYSSPSDVTLTQSIPIQVNLRSLVGAALTVSVANVANQVQLTLTNTLTCDVRVGGLATLRVGSVSTELALCELSGASLAGGLVIPAAGTATVVALTDRGAPTPSAEAIGLDWQGAPTGEQLLAICASFIGAHNDAPFPAPLVVETLPGYFRSGVGAKQLVKLVIEFTSTTPTTRVELTPTALLSTANLSSPILLALLNDPGAVLFSYRVTNVYSDGTSVSGDLLSWDGGSPLIVAANPPEGQSHVAT